MVAREHHRPQAQAALYRFGTKTADFHLCQSCGVIPVVTCMLEGRQYAVLNVNAFDDIDPAIFDQSPTDFEGETVDTRLPKMSAPERRRVIELFSFEDDRARAQAFLER